MDLNKRPVVESWKYYWSKEIPWKIEFLTIAVLVLGGVWGFGYWVGGLGEKLASVDRAEKVRKEKDEEIAKLKDAIEASRFVANSQRDHNNHMAAENEELRKELTRQLPETRIKERFLELYAGFFVARDQWHLA